jgi:hypothetical protein
MTRVNRPTRSEGRASQGNRPVRLWPWLSVPIAVLAMAGSIIGIVLDDRIYAKENPNWAAQAVGQDRDARLQEVLQAAGRPT